MAQWQRIHLPVQETWVPSLGLEDPLEKEMATHVLENPMDRGGGKAGYGPWGCKELDTSEHSRVLL